METIRLGKTEMMVSKLGLGGIPIQRVTENEAVAVVRRCLDLGVNFIDTADVYTTSEERIGKAIAGRREGLFIATKSDYGTRQEVESHLKQSLQRFGVESIDLYQFHGVSNFDTYAKVIDPDGPMAVLQEVKKSGLIKHIGISSHSIDVASEAIKSGYFETIMFPFNFVTREAADELIPLSREHDVGFIAMKPLNAGMIKNINIAFKYLLQFPDVIAIPGIEKIREIEEIAQIYEGQWAMTEVEKTEMQQLKGELDKKLCRRCGLCQVCPEGIPVAMVVDIRGMMNCMPPQSIFAGRLANGIEQVTKCTDCGECEEKCPYGLSVVEIMKENASMYLAEMKKYQEQAASG